MSTPISEQMYAWAQDLFPVCRSLTGDGVRETLRYIGELVPTLQVHEVPSGTNAFDWTVVDEWNIRDAYLEHESGQRFAEFSRNNLHVVGYSEPINATMTLDELQPHLHSLPEMPDAIPYVTSYYKRTWGFSLAQQQRDKMPAGQYRAVIDSSLEPGHLTYGEIVIPGQSKREVLLSTNICHPSMANNELSGPVVATALAQWLTALPQRRHTYRIVYIPETIGAVVYINRHLEELRKNVVAGFVLTCVGDNRAWSYLPSRLGGTLADKVAEHVLKHKVKSYSKYHYTERGSDERQYCSPKVDLPVCSIMRSKYGTYPEYHTSHDDLSVISPDGLEGAFEVYQECIMALEKNVKPLVNHPCEPQLGKYGIYPLHSKLNSTASVDTLVDVLQYCDGGHDLIDIAEQVQKYCGDLFETIETLTDNKLIGFVDEY